MAVKSGWFNSVRTVDPQTGEVSFDRVYDNETMNSFLKGLISTNGIFSNVGTHPLKVTYASDLTVTVNPGKAMVGNHWVEVTSIEPVTLDTASVDYPRKDAIVLRFDGSLAERSVSLVVKKGVISNNPTPPDLTGNYGNEKFDESGGVVELPLAYVKINRGAETIDPSDIDDMRGTSWCPFISHLVAGPSNPDVDTWLAETYTKIMNWYSTLTEELHVDTSLQHFTKVVYGGQGVSNSVPLDMAGYTYEESDIFIVQYNGLMLIRNSEYTISTGDSYPSLTLTGGNLSAGNSLCIQIIKNTAGTPSYIEGDDLEY